MKWTKEELRSIGVDNDTELAMKHSEPVSCLGMQCRKCDWIGKECGELAYKWWRENVEDDES